jgi:hypothetical protein
MVDRTGVGLDGCASVGGGVPVGTGGVYAAVWVSKKDATIVPTAAVMMVSGSCPAASSPSQAVNESAKRRRTRIMV